MLGPAHMLNLSLDADACSALPVVKSYVLLPNRGRGNTPYSNSTYTPRLPVFSFPLCYSGPLLLSLGGRMDIERVKIGRTVRLSPDINRRLLDLCEHLGVNPNAYLIGEIGKAVARDELTFRAQQQNELLFKQLGSMLQEG
jgi:hypothetical protein